MSWKSAEPRPPLTSITARLVILFTVAAAIIFATTSGLLYWGLAHSLEERSLHYLRDEVNILRSLLLKPDGLEGVAREINLETDTLEYVQHFVRVLDHQGAVLLATREMERLIPVSAFPVPREGQGQYGERGNWTTDDGQLFMLKAVRIEREDKSTYVLQVALNATRRLAILGSFRTRVLVVTACGVLASLLAAMVISRRGLRPLREIVRHTQRVSASHLDERLQPGDWPSELHDLAGSFNRMLTRLQDSFERLSHFASNMAHEFRTPLNNLMGETDVMLARPRSTDDYQQLLESQMEEYRRLSQIVDSLLFLARVENGAQPLKPSQFELGTEIENLVDYYLPMAEEKGIALQATGPAAVNLSADLPLVRRAVANLLVNAIRYTPRHGSVTVSCRPLAEGGAAITVADTGCGIGTEEIPRLFDRFYRVETMRTDHPQGQGLGLSIVKSIMDLHDGRIDIQSRPGEGTTISLFFPAG